MQLIPAWAPNVHPMIVHFPIVLVMLAALADLIHVVRPRMRGPGTLAPSLYVLGALASVSAYVSGRIASATVFIPGMAHPPTRRSALSDDQRRHRLCEVGPDVLRGLLLPAASDLSD